MKKLPEIKQYKRIAIIQTAFLGDVALALYLAETIKAIHSKVEITFVSTPAASAFVSCSESIEHIIPYDKRVLQSGIKGIKFIAEDLRNRQIDCIISLHKSIRTTLIAYLSKAEYTVSFDKSALSFLYNKRIKYHKYLHEIERNNKMLEAFSDTNEYFGHIPKVNIDIDEDDILTLENKLLGLGAKDEDKIIVIAPGSIWDTKRWLPEYFIDLAVFLAREGYFPIITGSKDDVELCNQIAEKSNTKSLAGEISIPELLQLMSRAKLNITNDSAPTHFAGLMQCPTITIYGPTIPEFGFAPIGKFDKVVQPKELKCRPCAIHGSRKCPIKTFDCMKEQKPDSVFELCMDMLKSKTFVQE